MTYDLFRNSPEQIAERKEEKAPRQYAREIFLAVPEHRRMEEIDRVVPKHLRDWVREYLRDWAMREKNLEGKS